MSAATDLIHRLEEDVDSLEHRKQAKGKIEQRKQHKNFCGHECHARS